MPNFKLINTQLAALLENETNLIANLANASALLNDSIDQLNWSGFYLYDPKENWDHFKGIQPVCTLQ